MELKDRLKALRTERNITVNELATAFGKAESTVRMWESGNANPDIITLSNLADYLDVTTDYLLGKNTSGNQTESSTSDKNVAEINNNPQFNDNLKTLRTNLGLTQKEFANKLNLSMASIIAYEQAQKKPSFDVLLNIAKQFNTSLDWLCGVKKTDTLKIKEWSDAFKIIKILSEFDTNILFDVQETQTSLSFTHQDSPELFSYIKALAKMQKLLHEEHIDNELYELWAENENKKYESNQKGAIKHA